MLTSSFMLSAGLKVTNNFDSFLLIAPGALLVGFVWAKHIFPWSVSATKLSQFLYFPVDLGVLAKDSSEKVMKKINTKTYLKNMILFYTKSILL